MKCIRTMRIVSITLLLAALLAADAAMLQAQSSFILSKNEDFSTDDRVFARSDVLYALITAPQIDFTDLEKNEFRLKPDDGGNDIRGVFTNHFNDTYTASVSLAITDPNESDWEWRARIEDDDGNKFEVRVDLQIGDDNESEDEEDDEDEVEFTGTVEALDAGSITVNGITFVVTDETVILDDDNNAITFDDLAVGMTVEIRGEHDADGVLVATDIKIEDEEDDEGEEDEDEVEFTGTIGALDAGSITVGGITFVVTEGTIILDDDNNAITFDDLAVGMTVEIRGERDADGVLVATDIKIEDPPAAAGRIETMDDDRLTVEAHTFLIDDDTRVLDARAAPISLSDLEVGQTVEVHARTVAAAAMPVAAQIKVMGGGDVAAALEETGGDVPVRFVLGQNYPNPFNPETTISFELVKGARERVSLVIYNILGEAVRTLVQGELGPGRYQYAWDARNQRGHLVASGLYLYRLRVGDQVQTRRMVLLK